MEQEMTSGLLDKLDDLNFVVVELIASPAYPDFVGMH
jgi:hypothetical protein